MIASSVALLSMLGPSVVKIEPQDAGYRLLRNGQPYVIKGAGGGEAFLALQQAGGNSVRTWGAENLEGQLDRCRVYGLTMTVGIWLGHKRHGFKYDDPKMLQDQFDKTRGFIRRYRNHPSVLMWALGNEMELDGDEDAIWQHVEKLAKMVKEEDPNHPVMTVVAEINPEKLKRIMTLAPSLDLLGINSYAGLPSLQRRLKEQGFNKPYVVTEHGFYGQWEAPKSSWNIPLEPSSTDKAKKYAENYLKAIAPEKQCLGSYVFLWGQKQEQTATWHGMFLSSGEALGSVDEMTKAWTGQYPKTRAPEIMEFQAPSDLSTVPAGSKFSLTVKARDLDGDKLSYVWEVRPEQDQTKSGGDEESLPNLIPDTVSGMGETVEITAPKWLRTYRVFLTIYDGKGKAATANVPFRVVAASASVNLRR
jgi:hypothetical protein